MEVIKRLFLAVFSKKKIAGWVGAGLIAVGAAFAGMKSDEVKSAICETAVPQIENPVAETPSK